MQYYYITDLKMIGKMDGYVPYVYDTEKGWVPDRKNQLMDRIMGYDGESIGNSSLLFTLEEITKEEANEIIENMNKS